MADKLYIDDGLGRVTLEEDNPVEFHLVDPFVYVSLAGKTIVVPSRFQTDGTSSPFRVLIETWGGHYSTAALVHDYLYSQLDKGTPDPAAPTRLAADDILFEIMKRCGVNFWVRWGMYIAVRGLGGPGMRGLGVASATKGTMP